MSFLNPLAFLFLLTVPALILLYFLKLKRPQVKVPSTLLWRKVIEDMRVNSPFQRLKRSLLLLLQLLALAAVIAALARPLLRVREDVSESIIAVLDNSASMSAVEEGGKTRLQLAKSELLGLVDQLSKEDEMMLIVFNRETQVGSGFTADKRKLRDAVSAVEPAECATRIEPALMLAKSICNSRSHPRVLLFSDGAFEGVKDLEMPVEIEYRRIGSSRPNLAVTGLDIRRSLSDKSKIEMFVAAENFSERAFTGNMIVRLNNDALDSKYFSVGPREVLSQIFEASLPAGGNIQVEFDVKDALACDNRAWKVVTPPSYHRVLIVGENTFFLERAFKASPGIEYTAVPPSGYGEENAGDYFAVIWNAVDGPKVAPCNNIYLGCFPDIKDLVHGEEIESPDILDWDNAHPVNRFLDFDNLILSSAYSMKLPEYATVILRSSRTPLIGMFKTGDRGICIAGFDPMKSNWPLLVSFPMFLNNCLDYFEESRIRKVEPNITTGRAITVPAPESPPAVEAPGGGRETLVRNSSGDYSYTKVNKCGIYNIYIPDAGSYSIAANLFDHKESLLEAVENPVVGGARVRAMQADKQVNREYWKHLVMALAGLLLIEWVVYHRRLFV